MPFRKDTSILYYNPKPPTSWKQRKYFLYPVRMYRVVAPRLSSRKVNILEKAVLGMYRAGITEAIEISQHLDIGKDLTALILTQLTEQQYIDLRGNLTQRGKRILEDETWITQDAIAGFIFQDPWLGDLFPRFVEREEYVDTRLNDKGYPDLILGTTGKPNYLSAFLPQVKKTIERQPSPTEIIDAVHQHRRTLRNISSIKADDEDWVFERIPNLDRVSFIDEEPRDLWLATYIYVPEDFSSTDLWNVCDPFGLGDSPWLLRKLEKHRKDKTISGLESLISSMLNEQQKQVFQNFDEWFDLTSRNAEFKVANKLTSAIRGYSELFEYFVAVERAYIEATELTQSNPKRAVTKLEDISRNLQKAAECLFKIIRNDFPTKNLGKRLPESQKEVQSTLNAYAKNAGFYSPLPNKLLNFSKNDISRTANSGNGSLRSLILASLLATPDNTAHPLRLMAHKFPDLLANLDKLADIRNAGAHASGQDQIYELSEIEEYLNTVYRFAAETLQLSYQP